jgi:hypothetical protein
MHDDDDDVVSDDVVSAALLVALDEPARATSATALAAQLFDERGARCAAKFIEKHYETLRHCGVGMSVRRRELLASTMTGCVSRRRAGRRLGRRQPLGPLQHVRRQVVAAVASPSLPQLRSALLRRLFGARFDSQLQPRCARARAAARVACVGRPPTQRACVCLATQSNRFVDSASRRAPFCAKRSRCWPAFETNE